MKTIVLLFTKSDVGDSENFPFAGLTKVNVIVEGNPSDVYSEGLAKRDMYDEARRFFGDGEGPRTCLAENFTRTTSPASWTSEPSTTRTCPAAGED